MSSRLLAKPLVRSARRPHDSPRREAEPAAAPRWDSARRRPRLLAAFFAAFFAVVFARIVSLEIYYGADYRREAVRPSIRASELPAARARILDRHGAVLATDAERMAVAVDYRWLESPPDRNWLRRMVRKRLTSAERRDPARVAAAEAEVMAERERMLATLAAAANVPAEQLADRARTIQSRVARMADDVNRRRGRALAEEQQPTDAPNAEAGSRAWLHRLLLPDHSRASARITIAEELADHVLIDGLEAAAAARIQTAVKSLAGVRLVRTTARVYPRGETAAHVLGYAASDWQATPRLRDDDEAISVFRQGRAGLEAALDEALRGRAGRRVELVSRFGGAVERQALVEPIAAADVRLSIDINLQQLAERLLHEPLATAGAETVDTSSRAPAPSGAVVVLDVESGELLACASYPRFDPNAFAASVDPRVAAALADGSAPLYDRAAQMALAPGAVFKPVAALALLESGVNPHEKFACRGYLRQPDRQRCGLYRQFGLGHGPLNLVDALARNCHVYFLHHADAAAPDVVADQAAKFGLGTRTGVETPSESAGSAPNIARLAAAPRDERRRAIEAQLIGQETLTATPLQAARLMAAIANGGRLVRPTLLFRGGANAENAANADSVAIDAAPEHLALLQKALAASVADAEGAAHRGAWTPRLALAGVAGVAETGSRRQDHAWFAGYAPADDPQIAICVALADWPRDAVQAGRIARELALQGQAASDADVVAAEK